SDRAKQNDQRRHAISNVVIDKLDATRATAIAYGVVTAAGGGELYLGATVIYRGDMRKMPDGTWRFAKLVIGMDAYRRAAK
ncbi:MAG: nuclear transport factor 2 family protein, partial [Proteobacteria bacterium]|nr:nuclear transport factor 2 family protein [Pseudomonadota bacterium]